MTFTPRGVNLAKLYRVKGKMPYSQISKRKGAQSYLIFINSRINLVIFHGGSFVRFGNCFEEFGTCKE